MVNLSNATDWLKLKPRYIFALALCTGLLIFMPIPLLQRLGLESLTEIGRPWIGGVFLLSSVLLIAHAVSELALILKPRIFEKLWIRASVRRLYNLTSEEKAILRDYISKGSRTQELNISNGVVNGLVVEKIIFRASSLGDASGYFAYNIQPWVWTHLKKHPELLNDKQNEK